ncbi:MAG TPA: sigma-70 family RNA polymerase sigma factor [Steroidobacteraceae bacterium]|nr:sigma-70 family RNA polymerase sigma factor [Steroidobacteraceae bacterium]
MNEAAAGFSDEQLVKARAGDSAALALLIRAHQRSVYSLALRLLGTKELAEDLTQEVFMQLNGNLKSIASNTHLLFWLRKVTSFRAIDQLRRRSRIEMTSLEDEASLISPAEGGDPLLQRHLQQLLMELSPPARAVLLLRYQEDLDPVDIARTLEMPINTVKSHLQRSLGILRQRIAHPDRHRCEDEST